MLRNKFYNVLSLEEDNTDSIKASISLIKEDAIFKGHFPQIPIVPGVCMMQIVKEILEEKLNRRFRLHSASNIKFLALINPLNHSQVEIDMKYSINDNGNLLVEAVIYHKELIFFKLNKGIYR